MTFEQLVEFLEHRMSMNHVYQPLLIPCGVASFLWALRVQSGAQPASATERYLRELKRMMLYGVVQPNRHPDLMRAINGAPDPTTQAPARRPKALRNTR